eukprot:XP_011663553.1 PREDICTED: uncharacterized protein LOC105437995 [Strongylocentrotus purpuratus]
MRFGTTEELFQADSTVQLYDFTLKTSLQQCTKPLLGPVTLDLLLRTNHEPHSASELSPLLPRIFADLNVRNIPITFGQENLNCLTTVIDKMNEVLGEGGGKGREKKKVPAKKFKFKIDPSLLGVAEATLPTPQTRRMTCLRGMTGVPDYLKGFTPDASTPKNHEFMVVRIPETKLIIESYGGVHARTRISDDGRNEGGDDGDVIMAMVMMVLVVVILV